jgi:hypothetical protein
MSRGEAKGIRGVRSGPGAAGWQQTIANAMSTVASSQDPATVGQSVSIPRLSLRLPAHAGEREVAAALASAIARETARARRGGSR